MTEQEQREFFERLLAQTRELLEAAKRDKLDDVGRLLQKRGALIASYGAGAPPKDGPARDAASEAWKLDRQAQALLRQKQQALGLRMRRAARLHEGRIGYLQTGRGPLSGQRFDQTR